MLPRIAPLEPPYEPSTGECVSGPPFGKFLTPILLTIRDDDVIAICPADLE